MAREFDASGGFGEASVCFDVFGIAFDYSGGGFIDKRGPVLASCEMAQAVSLLLSARDRTGLRDVIEDSHRPVEHVQRAQIVLASADHLPVLEIANRVGVSRPMLWRWQRRYAEEGLDGLLRDKMRPPGTPPVPQVRVYAVVERTLRAPPGAVTHWTGRAGQVDGPVAAQYLWTLARAAIRLQL